MEYTLENDTDFMRFDILTAVCVKVTEFRDMKPCSWYICTNVSEEATASISCIALLPTTELHGVISQDAVIQVQNLLTMRPTGWNEK
jgi:hypothetical protein